jgi:hypothetical protein
MHNNLDIEEKHSSTNYTQQLISELYNYSFSTPFASFSRIDAVKFKCNSHVIGMSAEVSNYSSGLHI